MNSNPTALSNETIFTLNNRRMHVSKSEAYIHPTYKQRLQKEVGSDHCHPRRSDCRILCRSLHFQEWYHFIHHEPTFHLWVKNQRHISFFSSIFFYLDYNFEQFLFCFNNICFFSTLLFYDRQFWRQKRTNSAWGKKEIQFFWKGKVEIFLWPE